MFQSFLRTHIHSRRGPLVGLALTQFLTFPHSSLIYTDSQHSAHAVLAGAPKRFIANLRVLYGKVSVSGCSHR
jgi:hypothetical protein